MRADVRQARAARAETASPELLQRKRAGVHCGTRGMEGCRGRAGSRPVHASGAGFLARGGHPEGNEIKPPRFLGFWLQLGHPLLHHHHPGMDTVGIPFLGTRGGSHKLSLTLILKSREGRPHRRTPLGTASTKAVGHLLRVFLPSMSVVLGAPAMDPFHLKL